MTSRIRRIFRIVARFSVFAAAEYIEKFAYPPTEQLLYVAFAHTELGCDLALRKSIDLFQEKHFATTLRQTADCGRDETQLLPGFEKAIWSRLVGTFTERIEVGDSLERHDARAPQHLQVDRAGSLQKIGRRFLHVVHRLEANEDGICLLHDIIDI
jgi:hypothetical protein